MSEMNEVSELYEESNDLQMDVMPSESHLPHIKDPGYDAYYDENGENHKDDLGYVVAGWGRGLHCSGDCGRWCCKEIIGEKNIPIYLALNHTPQLSRTGLRIDREVIAKRESVCEGKRRLIPELTASRRAEPGSHEERQSRETKTRSAASLPVHRQLETGWIRLCGIYLKPARRFSPFSAQASSSRH
ncbi:hypothetical protein AB1E19_007443 [Capra hircus]